MSLISSRVTRLLGHLNPTRLHRTFALNVALFQIAPTAFMRLFFAVRAPANGFFVSIRFQHTEPSIHGIRSTVRGCYEMLFLLSRRRSFDGNCNRSCTKFTCYVAVECTVIPANMMYINYVNSSGCTSRILRTIVHIYHLHAQPTLAMGFSPASAESRRRGAEWGCGMGRNVLSQAD